MNRMRQDILQAALGPPRLGAGAAEQSFCFGEGFVGFAGHFPDYPILPAILQTLTGQLLAEQLHHQSLQLLGLARAKFMRQVRVAERVDVSLGSHDQDGLLHCATRLRVAGETAAEFTLILCTGHRI